MPILKNDRHERFAQLRANGKSASEAYSQAGYNTGNAESQGPRLSGNVLVSARIAELKGRQELYADITRKEVMKILGKLADITPEELPTYQTKLKAIELLIKMCGWNEAEKHEIGPNNELTALLKRLRGGGS